jgi:hypothetical protein
VRMEEPAMKKMLKPIVLGLSLPALLLLDFSSDAPRGLVVGREAAAIIGVPVSPVSVAGVARRTTRRVVATEAAVATTAAAAQPKPPPPPPPAQAPAGPVPVGTVIQTLPPGCAPTPIKGIEYYNCGPGVFYRSAFQGNNLVYVAAQP